MRVVSFYSYKGGTGRTLLVANLAVYAARLGRTVVMVDLDLEAPGLAYKFLDFPPARPGVIEWLTTTHRPSVAEMVEPLQVRDPFNDGGALWLIGAGPPPSQAYIRQVRHLQSTAFADDSTTAVEGMLDLRDAIEQQFQPDLLLLDARTGISNTNAVTTRVLADDVVALTLDTAEQREGTREVLRSLAPLTNPHDPTQPLGLHVIVSRIPAPEPGADDTGGGVRDKAVADAMRRYLTEPAEPLTTTLALPHDPLLLHEDAGVAVQEHLLLAERTSDARPRPLHFDYLRIAQQLLGSHILGPAIAQAFENISETQRFERAAFFGDVAQMLSAKAPTVTAATRPALGQDRSTLKRKVALLRKAAEMDPAREPDLAAALTDLAWAIFDARTSSPTPSTALRTLRQAQHIYDRLATTQPDGYFAAYVDSLVQYSAMAAQLGHLDEAETAAARAADLGMESTADYRVPELLRGKALANLADVRMKAGNAQGAVDAIRKATAIFDRHLDHGTDLRAVEVRLLHADAHARRATVEATLGDVVQALHSASIAVDRYRRIASEVGRNRSRTATAGLGRTLNNLAIIRRMLSHYLAAVEAAHEATVTLRDLAADEPELYLADLARAYENLSTCLHDAGDPDGALRAAHLAVHMWRDLVDTPAGLRDMAGLIGALNTLAAQYVESRRYADAISTCSEALSLAPAADGVRQPGVSLDPTLHHNVAAIWATFAAALRESQKPNDALQAALTAERLHAELPYGPSAEALIQLTLSIASLYSELHDTTAADAYIQRGIGLAEAQGDQKSLAGAYRVSAAAKSLARDYETAIQHAMRAAKLAMDAHDLTGSALALQLVADAWTAAGDPAQAAFYLELAERLRGEALRGSPPPKAATTPLDD